MSVLKTLKLAGAKPIHNVSPKDRGRAKLLGYLDEQQALAAAQIEGKPFNATKLISRTGENGERLRVEVVRKVRCGWFTDALGTLFFQIRYGAKPLELAKGMTAIQIDALEALPAAIDTIKQAIAAGELDAALAAAAAERKKNFKRKTAQA